MEALIGQSLWVGYEEPLPPDWLLQQISKGWVGAVILFARNIPKTANGDADLAKLVEITDTLHLAAEEGEQPPLWIAIDQEGGLVQRIKKPLPHWPPMGVLAGCEQQTAYDVGFAMGLELGHLGIDVSFAPVLDVNTNAANPIIGTRAFSSDPKEASALALAYAHGLRDNNIVPCGKHFPGHGDTDVDSHLALPKVLHDKDRFEEVELHPFKEAIKQDIEMLMTAHILIPSMDEKWPATLSSAIISDLLRGKLGYSGLVVSDDIEMKAIADNYGFGEASERAIRVGCDVVLLCKKREVQEEVRAHLIHRLQNDKELTQRFLEANDRIVSAKEDWIESQGELDELVLQEHETLREQIS